MLGQEHDELEADRDEGSGRCVEQRYGGLLDGLEGGVIGSQGLRQAGDVSRLVPGMAPPLKLRLEPLPETVAARAEDLVDGEGIGGEMKLRAGFRRELDTRIAKLLDEGRFEPIAVCDGLVAPAQRVVELAPEAEMNVGRFRCLRDRVAEERGSEQLRLKHENGLSSRVIAASLGLSKGAVGDYLRRAQAAGIGWPIDAALTDTGLERLLFPAAPDVMAKDRPEPDWPTVDRELRRSGVTRMLLWQEYRT